jgi:diguanylate cyclase (GGDEF)-like protein
MPTEVVGKTPSFLASGHHDDSFYKDMWESLTRENAWEGDIWNRDKKGALFASRTSINAVLDHDNNVVHYIGAFKDITLQLRKFEEVEQMAYHDALTGLPNRILFNDRLAQGLRQADRKKQMVGLCFLDLDKFKPVNDNYGHKVGDLLLVEVACRLRESIREGDTVARLGGDEFALVITDLASISELEEVLMRILEKCRAPFTIQQYSGISVSASIGVCIYPDNEATAEKLLKAADTAMYQAKESGRNKYVMYSGS